jgi:osmotically-inducible protein OsmY
MRRNGTALLTILSATLISTIAVSSCSTSGRDATITSKVRTVLQADRVVDATKIRVTTEKGVVTLAGSVAGEDAHRKAVELVTRVEGVRGVRDRLDVTPAPPVPAEAVPPASPLGGEGSPALGGVLASNRIRREPADQPGGNYGLLAAVVGPQDDVVLETRVEPAIEPAAHAELPSAEPKPFAAALSPTRGDEAVAVSLPDSPVPLRPADEEDAVITARVRESLAEVGGRVQVMTRGRVVVLSGAVETEYEKSRVLRLASETKGVARVEDRIVVLQS